MPKARKRGHPDVFTNAQNRALRDAFRQLQTRMKREGSHSQDDLAKAIGVVQQTASRLLVEGRFSYAPATALVQHLGYSGVDSFFLEKGVALLPRTGTHG